MQLVFSKEQELQPTTSIRHADVGGRRVVLDLRLESYRVLDSVASRMWEILIGNADKTGTLNLLSSQFDVPLARLHRDLKHFANVCVAERLLEPVNAATHIDNPSISASCADRLAEAFPRGAPRSSNPPLPMVMLALHSMILTACWIARRGFTATYQRYAKLPRGDSITNVDRSLTTFSHAENFFLASPAPHDCLARSLSLYHFLNRVNVAAEHVIGVGRFPFRAHAWVETGGTVALQSSVREYTPIARL